MSDDPVAGGPGRPSVTLWRFPTVPRLGRVVRVRRSSIEALWRAAELPQKIQNIPDAGISHRGYIGCLLPALEVAPRQGLAHSRVGRMLADSRSKHGSFPTSVEAPSMGGVGARGERDAQRHLPRQSASS